MQDESATLKQNFDRKSYAAMSCTQAATVHLLPVMTKNGKELPSTFGQMQVEKEYCLKKG